jgi:hypothetical protein
MKWNNVTEDTPHSSQLLLYLFPVKNFPFFKKHVVLANTSFLWGNGRIFVIAAGGVVIAILYENKKHIISWAPVAHACNPSYSGGRDQEDWSSKPASANSSLIPYLKKAVHKIGLVEPLYHKKKKKKAYNYCSFFTLAAQKP